jgi:broad specificity phosphatase PhoE
MSNHKMEKTIYFVRHAEAIHNRDAMIYHDFYEGKNLSEKYLDSELSEKGIAQCHNLKTLLEKELPSPDLIVSSTLTRAIQTARISYPDSVIVATDRCIERRSENISDKRSCLSELRNSFDNINFDDVLHDEYHLFESDKEIYPTPFKSDSCKKRAKEFVDWLFTRPEEKIIVFTHTVFLYHLVDVEELSVNTKFDNAKLYKFTLKRPVQYV